MIFCRRRRSRLWQTRRVNFAVRTRFRNSRKTIFAPDFSIKRFFSVGSWYIPRIMRHLGALATSFFLLFALGCGSYLGSAKRAYQEGRYLEVAENLSDHEADVPRLEPANQANYGLYRGLSLLRLGDDEAASQWLDFAADVEKKRPGSLLPARRRELEDARDKLAKTVEPDSATSELELTTRTASDTRP
jgi:hypothetical protein